MARSNRRDALKLGIISCCGAVVGNARAAPPADDVRKIDFRDSTKDARDDLPVGIGIRDPYFARTGRGAFVVDGTILALEDGLSDQHKADVVYSTLLAQRAASKKYDRIEKPDDWFGMFKQIMQTVGWVLQDFTFEPFKASKSTFQLSPDVLQSVLAAATQSHLEFAVSASKSLEALSDVDERVLLFEAVTHSKKKGTGQIGVAYIQSDEVVMHLGSFEYTTDSDITRSLSFAFDSTHSTCTVAQQKMKLNEDVFGRIREEIVTKLGNQRRIRIKNLDGEFA